MLVVGIHSLGHDISVCLWKDGELIFAIEAERLNRVRHSSKIDIILQALKRCQDFTLEDVSLVALSTYVNQNVLEVENYDIALKTITTGEHNHYETRCKLFGASITCVVVSHEASHASVALHEAGFQDNTTILVNEGRGIFSRNCIYQYRNNQLMLDSFNTLPWYGTGFGWSAFGYLFGMGKSPSTAGKIMAMGAFSVNPTKHTDAISCAPKNLHEMPLPKQNQICDQYREEWRITDNFDNQADYVGALQILFTNSIIDRLKTVIDKYNSNHIALSGGCALNIITNSAIRDAFFIPVHIPAVCNDAGQALGASIYAQKFVLGNQPHKYSVYSNGVTDSTEKTINTLKKKQCHFTTYDSGVIADRLAEGAVVAFYQGKAELGPRALGNRSLIANPKMKDIKRRVSEFIKQREWYRPLAPLVRVEKFGEFFPDQQPSPFMLFNYAAKPLDLPGATHHDGTARIQTVTEQSNPGIYNLLEKFEALTNINGLINTSLNAGGKPIAQTVADVLDDFWHRDVDCFVFNDIMVNK